MARNKASKFTMTGVFQIFNAAEVNSSRGPARYRATHDYPLVRLSDDESAGSAAALIPAVRGIRSTSS
jgi:hypothetical protein